MAGKWETGPSTKTTLWSKLRRCSRGGEETTEKVTKTAAEAHIRVPSCLPLIYSYSIRCRLRVACRLAGDQL
jgi:hypothetical protein